MLNTKNTWTPSLFRDYRNAEHDACGIVSVMEKRKIATKENIDLCIQSLVKMNHRAGFINGEGDGIGIHIDVPKALWNEKLKSSGYNPTIVDHPHFIVGHFFLNKKENITILKDYIRTQLNNKNFTIIFESDDVTNSDALGPLGKQEEPLFWQVALIAENEITNIEQTLFSVTIKIEENEAIHVASLSRDHVVYKVLGAGDTLVAYYNDLQHPLIASTMTLGHNRYSTNTLSNFFRVQPFSILGHNGEINTIAKLREQAEMIDVPLTAGGSDSQDLNRTLETLLVQYDYSLFEAMEILFPPIINEIKLYETPLKDLYTYIREAWGHFAQGPAGIISRFKDEAVFSVDSLGLRPVWKVETESSYIFSSEPGVVSPTKYVAEPKPLAPGEKVGLKWNEQDELVLYEYDKYQIQVYNRFKKRIDTTNYHLNLSIPETKKIQGLCDSVQVETKQYVAFGWDREHIQLLEQMATKGVEPIRSLGHDSPLAALDTDRRNIADFIKESVAVVTNPAIDRDREIEHFSTRTVLGERPSLLSGAKRPFVVEMLSPIILEGSVAQPIAEELHTITYEQLIELFKTHNSIATISATFSSSETLQCALSRISFEAIAAVNNGASLLVLDDAKAHLNERLWIDPHLVTAKVHQALSENKLRRNCSLVIRSGALRSLHDIVTLYGLGADGINPYLLFATVNDGTKTPITNLYNALNKGLEKVISTIGIHELRGYGRLYSSIGLHEEIANILQITNFFGSNDLAFSLESLTEDAKIRAEDYNNPKIRMRKSFHIFPRIWKAIGDVAKGNSYDDYRDKLSELEENNPIAIRHLVQTKQTKHVVPTEEVSIGIQNHNLPFIISSMSFGSQNEIAFRAYAEAADQLNMISLNGEGGEIKDMIGKYPHTRGQQVASGRFGVNAELLNSSNLIEIKIGQGAKPGEGGHLPGSKVTAKIAEARNATIGSDLISPSNNHDIYSIEDLAQMITEIKTANQLAKVAVKVPVVPNIGTIAVGIAKAGADFINISGFDGGTGAARIHALQHVGLPVEIGVKAAHNALLEASMRHKVEIWADGGIRSVNDALKIMLLGANRIGFGTLSMIAIGCTTCRGCHLDTCHVGIATQIESEAQAKEHGLRRFVPRELESAVAGLLNLFTSFGVELQRLTGQLGYTNLQAIVGRSDLLEQVRGENLLNLCNLLQILEHPSVTTTEDVPEKQFKTVHSADSKELVGVGVEQRVMGGLESCYRVRSKLYEATQLEPLTLKYTNGSIPGNGLGAYNSENLFIHVNGGAQDGIGKTSFGGGIYITKSKGEDGVYYNGSVGKGFGYGAQKGALYVQGNADARAGIRLSGADMIIGGRITKPLREKEHGNIGAYSNIKGFAFEYMTNGRALVLGDPGPWICAGMTGGVVYLRHDSNLGLTEQALKRRIAKGANVTLQPISKNGLKDVTELLLDYIRVLNEHEQYEEVALLTPLLDDIQNQFFEIIPKKEQADPSISTE
ncbi:glutamate synthase-related protein [Bacillus cereus]|uniref:glutamate synthase-related protein n=1 Tax=Bacillus cereus group TaxID=86661 RepID=UPI000BF41104|nr:glutamate synthase-related protein [Bacillus thuringiensis]MCU5131967.1 glutamate synthase-related protein [Bacillus cereus]KAB2363729.1 glutamate synthase [Bacillus thuringiensis]MED3356830.1 glutamate synthase-related protein [Bacillus thuringiensis]PFI27049.1 glutamate synthase [Bacillus thuringiensis]HDR4896959.1 glutamate synthase [Bacillus cereus]